jgi:hypothetical protein
MRTVVILTLTLLVGLVAYAVEFTFDEQPYQLVLLGDGKPWLSTWMGPYDPAKREETYKVYTHVFDLEGKAPITKGPGGKYTHHRGMFIGWKDTIVGDKHYNIWEMPNSTQQHVQWLQKNAGKDKATQVEKIRWFNPDGKPLVEETRTITATPGQSGTRVFDFQSTLSSLAGPIQLRGDLHHAGMKVRMENEVSEHEDTTQYILPEAAREEEGDKVVGAWWVCCSPVVREKRYWLMHMTPPDHPTGQPVYSIRRYARFGAFFETDLQEGKPLTVNFRILLSDKALDQAACAALYQEYAKTVR